MKKVLVIVLALVGVVLLSIFAVQGVKNRAISYEESIEQADSYVKAEEKRRFDLIPNLVECVKAYDEHEYNTLVKVIEARGKNMSGTEAKQCIAAFSRVEERYPDLKSQKNYQDLMNELALTENKIVEVRKAYNQQVTRYKRFVRQFPSKQLLSLTDYEILDYERLEFEKSSVDAPKVSF